MNKKKLSIRIPTYNREEKLDSLLMSIVELKTYPDEIIISDNGAIEYEFFLKYDGILNIKYYKNEKNIGFDENLIKSIMHASNDYVMIVGDDDLFIGEMPCVNCDSNLDIYHSGFIQADIDMNFLYKCLINEGDKEVKLYGIEALIWMLERVTNISNLFQFMSGLIFKKTRFLEQAQKLKKYVGIGYIHTLIAYDILCNNGGVCFNSKNNLFIKARGTVSSAEYDSFKIFRLDALLFNKIINEILTSELVKIKMKEIFVSHYGYRRIFYISQNQKINNIISSLFEIRKRLNFKLPFVVINILVAIAGKFMCKILIQIRYK